MTAAHPFFLLIFPAAVASPAGLTRASDNSGPPHRTGSYFSSLFPLPNFRVSISFREILFFRSSEKSFV